MPTSIEGTMGFSISKWELRYLKRRYWSHRQKVAEAKPVIDDNEPEKRNHVRQKYKKALIEEMRQTEILKENLRLLNCTADIMNGRERRAPNSSVEHYSKSTERFKYPIGPVLKRSAHILLRWFLIKFGKYIPWWAEYGF